MPMNLGPNNMNMMMMPQFQMMNDMYNNGLNQSFYYPLMPNFMNFEFYNKRNKDPLNDNNLSQTQKNLSLFFNCISSFNKNIKQFGTKIYINYYNLERIELYLDLRLQVKYLISIIFGLILLKYKERKYCIRMVKNKTTQEIIENPNIFYDSNLLYKNILHLEFNNNDLNQLSEKTGIEIGLKEGDELFLKLKKECYNELENLNLDNIIIFSDNHNKSDIIYFPSFKEEIVSDMCKRFTKFINFDDKLCNFFFNGEDLKNNSKKIKELLLPKSIIDFEHPYLKGGFDYKLVDVSKGKIKNLEFSKTAPKWRRVKEGLNIFGFCPNKECITNKNEVVYIPEEMDIKDNYFKYNIFENIKNMKCPICKRVIKAKTIGFYECEYQIIGEKIDEEGNLKQYDSKPKETEDNKFEYFDPDENGVITWSSLIIYVLPKQKIKYQSSQ
jgi:hypothetical protein